MKKNSCTPINPKKYSCYGLKKLHTRNLITKKNSCGSKIPLPPHNISNGPSLRRKWCWASTSKQTTQFPFHITKNKKLENGEDIEQGSSLAVVLNQSKKNWSYKNLFSRETRNVEFIVREMWNGHFIFYTWSSHKKSQGFVSIDWHLFIHS